MYHTYITRLSESLYLVGMVVIVLEEVHDKVDDFFRTLFVHVPQSSDTLGQSLSERYKFNYNTLDENESTGTILNSSNLK